MRRTLLRTMIVAALLLLPVAPASAQEYPPEPGPPVLLSASVVGPGGSLTLSSSGWLPGSAVDFTLFSDPISLGSAAVGSDTSFSATVTIPASVAPGMHTLQVSGIGEDGDPRVTELAIEVLGSAAGAPAGNGVGDPANGANGASGGSGAVGEFSGASNALAFTGANMVLGGALAAALVIAGGITLLVSRRRRRDSLLVDS